MEHLYDKLVKYSVSDYYGFHMPGHKRQQITGAEKLPYEIDITEIEGFDDLHHAEDLFINLQEYAAEVFHAEETHYLVNGSTVGLLSAVLGCTGYGDRILMARNCHKSVYNAVDLNGLIPEYVYPEFDETTDLNGEIRVEKIEQILEKDRGMNREAGIKAVVITSPTYDGVVSDIERISEVVHKYGIPLIVDEAHGAHFGFHEYFPQNANVRGADIVIHSLHKTLPSLTQTALLHMNGKLVDRDSVRRYLHMLQSSSPSYILMSSIDACMDKLEREGDEMFQVFTDNLEKARERLGKCKYIRLVTPEVCECQRVFDFDRSKILLSTVNSSLNGRQLHQILREEFHLEMEMEAENYVLALAAVGDTAEGFRRLCEAVEEIDRRESLKCKKEAEEEEPLKNGKMKQMMRISQAMDAESERCALEECIGRTSVEFAYLYPPGIPLIVPGEQISGHFVKNVRRYLEQGFEVQGLSDQTSETVCVVRNEM